MATSDSNPNPYDVLGHDGVPLSTRIDPTNTTGKAELLYARKRALENNPEQKGQINAAYKTLMSKEGRTQAQQRVQGDTRYTPSRGERFARYTLGSNKGQLKLRHKLTAGQGLNQLEPPNMLRYKLAKDLALIFDGLDMFLILPLIIAYIVSAVFSAGLGAIGLFLATLVIEVLIVDVPFYILVRKNFQQLKATQNVINRNINEIRSLQTKIQYYSRMYTAGLKLARQSRFMRGPLRRLVLRAGVIRKKILKTTIGRFIRRMAYEKIPVLEFLPLRYLGVKAMLEAHQEAYKAAQDSQKLRRDTEQLEIELADRIEQQQQDLQTEIDQMQQQQSAPTPADEPPQSTQSLAA